MIYLKKTEFQKLTLNADIIKTGYLGDTLNGNYIDLENGKMYMNAERSELRYVDKDGNKVFKYDAGSIKDKEVEENGN